MSQGRGQLEGRVALITGAAGGIGRASAQVFAREGAKVVVVDIDADGGEETVQLIGDAGGEAAFVRADVSVEDDVIAMVRTAVDTFGRLDCAHNNAGVAAQAAPVGEYPVDEWDRVTGVMLRGVFLCLRHEIPVMLEQGGGAIVNTASGAGLVGFPGQAPYVAAKHGVLGLTKVAALDHGAQGVRVNAICPGTAMSPMVERVIEAGMGDYLNSLHPIGRIGTAEEIAEAAMWLCTDAASFVLGAALSVDGGYVIQ